MERSIWARQGKENSTAKNMLEKILFIYTFINYRITRSIILMIWADSIVPPGWMEPDTDWPHAANPHALRQDIYPVLD